MPAPESFTTARLHADRVTSEHEPFVRAIFSDARVNAMLGGPRDETRVRHDIERWQTHWDDHGFGFWIVSERATRTPVGWTMLHTTSTGGADGVEVGWTIAADHWRQGFACEAGTAATEIGFDVLALDEIVSFTQPHNVASRGVMEKIGFTYDGDVVHADLPHVLYRLDRETWEASRG